MNKLMFFQRDTGCFYEFDSFEEFVKWTVSSVLPRFVLIPPHGYNAWVNKRNDDDYWHICTWPDYD